MDYMHNQTEAQIREIERIITEEYAKAEKEIQEKLDEYFRKFRKKDALKRKAVENGLLSNEDYIKWRTSQLMVGKEWEALKDSIALELANASQTARSIAYGYMSLIYAENYNYTMYMADVLADGKLATSFTLYSRDAVAVLFKDGNFWHAPGKRISELIAMGKQVEWDKRQIQSVMMQSILQGDSIPHMASRLARSVGESDRKAAIRNARTMATGVQNAGRQDSIRRANEMGEEFGIKVMKQWMATLDGRTRHWHAELDGVMVPDNEPFVNDYGEIDYPGDPGAEPANVYNCRCTMLSCLEGLGFNNSLHPSVTGRQMGKDLNGISYEEWKAGHYKQHSDSITKQDEIAERMRNLYGAEYARYARL